MTEEEKAVIDNLQKQLDSRIGHLQLQINQLTKRVNNTYLIIEGKKDEKEKRKRI